MVMIVVSIKQHGKLAVDQRTSYFNRVVHLTCSFPSSMLWKSIEHSLFHRLCCTHILNPSLCHCANMLHEEASFCLSCYYKQCVVCFLIHSKLVQPMNEKLVGNLHTRHILRISHYFEFSCLSLTLLATSSSIMMTMLSLLLPNLVLLSISFVYILIVSNEVNPNIFPLNVDMIEV